MSESGSDVMRRWFGCVWNDSKCEMIPEMFPPEGLAHGIGGGLKGPEQFKKEFWEPLHETFDDIRVDVLDAVDQGDMTYVRCEAHVTFNGKDVVIPGGSYARVVDGKILEAWDAWDFAGAMEQMGALPPNAFALACGGGRFSQDD